MIERAEDRVSIRSPMTFSEAVALRAAVLDEIDRDGMTIDLGAVTEADSTALSLLLEWQRAAKARGWRIAFANLSGNMRSLAEVYGVLGLIEAARDPSVPST
jgi:phospholipid transport system transporter-binding protein